MKPLAGCWRCVLPGRLSSCVGQTGWGRKHREPTSFRRCWQGYWSGGKEPDDLRGAALAPASGRADEASSACRRRDSGPTRPPIDRAPGKCRRRPQNRAGVCRAKRRSWFRTDQSEGTGARWDRGSERGRDAAGRDRSRPSTFIEPSGEKDDRSVVRSSALEAPGPKSLSLPDLVVLWSPHPEAGLRCVRSPRFGDVVRDGVGSGRSGNHCEGAWACVVPGGSWEHAPGVEPVRAIDLASTVCAVMDVPRDDLPGRSLLH